MENDNDDDTVLVRGTRIVGKTEPEPVDHTITNVATGEEMSEEDKAELRALLVSGSIRMAPGVEDELKEHGITVEDVIEAMRAGASNKLA